MTVSLDHKSPIQAQASFTGLATFGCVFHGAQHNEFRIARDSFAIPKQALELLEIVQVAIADNPQFPTNTETSLRIHEHLPGDIARDRLLLMKRRIAQHGLKTPVGDTGQRIINRKPATFEILRSV